MIYQPPHVARDWPAADRLAYIAWLARLTLHRIDLDNPAVPLLAKRPVRSLFEWVEAIADDSAEDLETLRERIMREHDPAKNYNSVEVPADWLEVLAELQEKGDR